MVRLHRPLNGVCSVASAGLRLTQLPSTAPQRERYKGRFSIQVIGRSVHTNTIEVAKRFNLMRVARFSLAVKAICAQFANFTLTLPC